MLMRSSRLCYLFFFLTRTLIMLSACGVLKDTYEGMTGKENSSENAQEQSEEKQSNEIIVEVIVESDGDTVNDLEVEINARKNPESVSFDSVEVPYNEEFSVSTDAFIPLTSTRVEASVADNANEVSCTILYDGEEVATHQSQGNNGKAICEKKFQLGPG